ncbi:uncharacterized protein LOC111074487 [Drosophila obscura]|uniref:uncharacterized protein LOC111074487 n=1 Tax=Drosophila obscura TaxID=7282 RepID=UPI001BB0EAA3|nr:uncharacterized protein LOC111074487 [Drosophila obscura]
MEVETNSGTSTSTSSDKIKSSQTPVLIISERRRDTPRIRGKKKEAPTEVPTSTDREQPKITIKTFPTILSRIMLKSNVPPVLPPNDYPYAHAYAQTLCFLCLEKPAERKWLYHMFLSTDKTLGKDSEAVTTMYRNRADIIKVNQLTISTICARSLYRSVQKHFSDAVWNKQGNVFEMEKIGSRDIWVVHGKVNKLHAAEVEKLLNYIKYLNITKS